MSMFVWFILAGFGLGVGFTLGRWVVLAAGEMMVDLYVHLREPYRVKGCLYGTAALGETRAVDDPVRTTIRSLVAIDRATPR